MRFIKDFLSPILCALAMLAGIAYSTGTRDQSITDIKEEYRELKIEVKSLRESVDQLNQSVKQTNRDNSSHIPYRQGGR